MDATTERSLLWTPDDTVKEAANLTGYRCWLERERGLSFADYRALWEWSVTEVGAFWQSVWDYFDVQASATAVTPLSSLTMPGTEWFPGARLNYAENIFHKMAADQPAIYYKAENQPLISLTHRQIYEQTAALAHTMQQLGIQPGDRVVAYLPNIPETIIAFLAAASLGAVWSSCSPDFGSRSVLDRFNQIQPRLLLAVDGYEYGGKTFDRRDSVAELQAALPTLEHTILIPHLAEQTVWADVILWEEAVSNDCTSIPFAQLPFDHPLWILYSSGTTGLPKPIVQGHGGILLEHLKATTFHNDLKPGDRFFWFTSTGWMMWNYLVGSLLTGSAVVLYNGSPGYPDMNALWQLAAESGITYFGTSAAFISACIKAEIHPNQMYDLSQIRGVGSTGSPLTAAGFEWIYKNVNSHLALESLSGGTDLCTAFVGGVRILPIYAGEIQGASLGAKVQAFNEAGKPVINEVGELVITTPMPSMPLYFWNDPAMTRYKSSYFDLYPGVWRHGDWIKFNERGGCVIYGRSDSTINRQGVRMGTSEIYQAVESLPELQDCLVIDLELLGRESYMPLFVVLREGCVLDDDLRQRIRHKLRQDVSPRHVPDDIIQIDEVPYTLSGKKMEVPIRKILLGMEMDTAVNPGAMRNPHAIRFFRDFAGKLAENSHR
jgi:acetoacetyl-CoA synthetase